MSDKNLHVKLQEIISLRGILQKLTYDNPKYDEIEEKLYDIEDAFQKRYGDYLQEVLQKVHDTYRSDTDILQSVAYIAKNYTINKKGEYSIGLNEGVYIETEKFPNQSTQLAIVPNPMRIILNIGNKRQEIAWQNLKMDT